MRTSRVGVMVAALLMVLPGTAWAAGGGQDTTPLFTVNLGTSVWTALVFLMLLGILWRFAWGPILAAVEAREKGIRDALDEAARRNEESQELLEQHRQQLADARRQASEVLSDAKAAGDRVRKELEEKARVEAQGIVERARVEIERERDAALDTLRKESVDLALAAASRLLEQNLDQAKNRELVEGYLQSMTGGQGAEA